ERDRRWQNEISQRQRLWRVEVNVGQVAGLGAEEHAHVAALKLVRLRPKVLPAGAAPRVLALRAAYRIAAATAAFAHGVEGDEHPLRPLVGACRLDDRAHRVLPAASPARKPARSSVARASSTARASSRQPPRRGSFRSARRTWANRIACGDAPGV